MNTNDKNIVFYAPFMSIYAVLVKIRMVDDHNSNTINSEIFLVNTTATPVQVQRAANNTINNYNSINN